MTTIHYSDLAKSAPPAATPIATFPLGYWTGLAIIASVWMVLVLTLIATVHD